MEVVMRNDEGFSVICKETGKRCYTKREAGLVINGSKKNVYVGHHQLLKRNHRNSKNIPRRKYYCKDCGFYHVTHQAYCDSEFHDNLWENAIQKRI